MFLTEGTIADLFYSIMVKPTNIKPVYRLGTTNPSLKEIQMSQGKTLYHFILDFTNP